MEKRKPHYDLSKIRESVAILGAAAFTKTALDGGHSMGLITSEMLTVVASLSQSDFYKSMTSTWDHKVWQDVYHAATPVGKTAYLKVTMHGDVPVIQFKEK